MTDKQRAGGSNGMPETAWPEVQQETAPVSAAPEPAPAEPNAVSTATLPPRDFEAELAQKDVELKALEAKMSTVEGATKEAQDERQKMVIEVARLVNERESIEREKNEALTKKTEELAEVSQATQTLAQKTVSLEQQLQEAQAKATKLEVVTSEFPDLLRYARYIPASADPDEVRSYCRSFQETREQDLGEYRQMFNGGTPAAARIPNPQVPVTRMPEPFGDATQLEERLAGAMRDPRAFEAELEAAIRNYEARRP